MEKTFEELIEEHTFDIDNWNVGLTDTKVLDLLKQVREATIKECEAIVSNHNEAFEILSLEPDKIRIDENK